MPKGYIIGRLTVTDPESYKAYVAAATAVMKTHGAKVLARGGRSEPLEGDCRPRNVVLEFESYDAAKRYYHSDEYQAAIKLRLPFSEAEMVLVEGYDGP